MRGAGARGKSRSTKLHWPGSGALYRSGNCKAMVPSMQIPKKLFDHPADFSTTRLPWVSATGRCVALCALGLPPADPEVFHGMYRPCQTARGTKPARGKARVNGKRSRRRSGGFEHNDAGLSVEKPGVAESGCRRLPPFPGGPSSGLSGLNGDVRKLHSGAGTKAGSIVPDC